MNLHRPFYWLEQLRPAHWIKNGVLFVPAFFSGGIFHLSGGQYTDFLLSIAAFSAAGSAVYALNDILDVDHDRRHAVKKLRPLARGAIHRGEAALVSICCLLGAMVFAATLPAGVVATLGGYLVLQVAYCLWLKHVPILDVSSISAGFLLRLAAGGILAAAPLSHWIVIITFLFMFSIALTKRRDDLVLTAEGGALIRPAQAGYNTQFIDIAKGIGFSITLVAYVLYTVSPEVMQRIGSRYVYVTALPVFLGIMRYLQLSLVHKSCGDPVSLVLRDPFLLLSLLSWAIMFYVLIYA